jgi:molecular chaperone DnaK
MANQNKTIGRFVLADIPPAPRGIPQIEVTFDIDANGILNVSAKDKATGKEQSIRIEASSGLSEDEISRMKAEAEANADSDKKAKERAEKMNAADGLIFQVEKFMRENGEKVPEDKKSGINEAMENLKNAHKSEDLDGIDSAMEKLNAVFGEVASAMYANDPNGAAGNPGGDTSSKDGGEDVTDVDFEEVK